MRLYYIFLSCLVIQSIAKYDYKKIINNVKNNDYNEAITYFNNITQHDARYWFFYACLYHKQLLDNILSDDVKKYFTNTLKTYNKCFDLDDDKYKQYTTENLISLYNYFILRGIKWVANKQYDNALECFNYAKQALQHDDDEDIDIKMLYVNILKNIKEDTINDDLLNNYIYNYLLLYIYYTKEEHKKALSIINRILEFDKYDLFALQYLYKMGKDTFQLPLKDKFYEAAMLYFDNKFKDAYDILKILHLSNNNYKQLYCDCMYQYCKEIQNTDKKLFLSMTKECINICKDIFYNGNDNKTILRRLYFLYKSINDVKSADDIIKYHKIKI